MLSRLNSRLLYFALTAAVAASVSCPGSTTQVDKFTDSAHAWIACEDGGRDSSIFCQAWSGFEVSPAVLCRCCGVSLSASS